MACLMCRRMHRAGRATRPCNESRAVERSAVRDHHALSAPFGGPLRAPRCIFRAHGCPYGYYADPTSECRCNPFRTQRHIADIFAMLFLLVLEHHVLTL